MSAVLFFSDDYQSIKTGLGTAVLCDYRGSGLIRTLSTVDKDERSGTENEPK